MTKLERIENDLSKAQEKLAEAQARVKELEVLRTEEENNMIVQMVRKTRMSHQELAAFLERNKSTLTNPAKKPSVPLGNDNRHEDDGPNLPESDNNRPD